VTLGSATPQVEREIESLTENCRHKINTLCVYGGVAYNKQERELKEGIDMVFPLPIASPPIATTANPHTRATGRAPARAHRSPTYLHGQSRAARRRRRRRRSSRRRRAGGGHSGADD
jgi:hypothetical protein